MMEVLYGRVGNGDTATRTFHVNIIDGVNALMNITPNLATITQGKKVTFPTAEVSADNCGWGGSRLILSGIMQLQVIVKAVSANQNTRLGLAALINGGVPTVTESGASTPVIAVDTEQVY